MTWRERFRPVIAKVLRETKAHDDEKDVRRRLREAYDALGCVRMGWAYQCWLDEVARQRGKKSGPIERRSKKAKQQRNDEARQLVMQLRELMGEELAEEIEALDEALS